MRLLLDTHIWLWALLEPRRLSRRVARALEDTSNELWLSPVSAWEAVLLCERGRVVVDDEPVRWVREALGAFPVREAPLTREEALVSREIRLPHGDPADRFIVATAVTRDLTLVTADTRLQRPAGPRRWSVLANRVR